jgi:hypothetical protein
MTGMSGEDITCQLARIDQMHTDIQLKQAQLRQEMRTENRKFLLQIVLALITALGIGIALGRFWLFHT